MQARTLRPLVALLCVSLLAPGCAAWREVRRTTPTQYLTEHHPKRVRLTLQDSSLVLRNPRASADSIAGIPERDEVVGMPLSIPESQVRALAIRGPSTWPMWVAGGTAAALVVMLIAQGPKGIKTNP